mmetsp:Transcript_139052/g.352514  ORF Transcript_139052/g.352514 Transcript_139052/m.352514 type:complete len:206 (-) Transcript_139052:1328-1945(-)
MLLLRLVPFGYFGPPLRGTRSGLAHRHFIDYPVASATILGLHVRPCICGGIADVHRLGHRRNYDTIRTICHASPAGPGADHGRHGLGPCHRGPPRANRRRGREHGFEWCRGCGTDRCSQEVLAMEQTEEGEADPQATHGRSRECIWRNARLECRAANLLSSRARCKDHQHCRPNSCLGGRPTRSRMLERSTKRLVGIEQHGWGAG